jgi:hypothetical protein
LVGTTDYAIHFTSGIGNCSPGGKIGVVAALKKYPLVAKIRRAPEDISLVGGGCAIDVVHKSGPGAGVGRLNSVSAICSSPLSRVQAREAINKGRMNRKRAMRR